MNQKTWYVTFEVPRSGTLVQRRNPRLTKTFNTEAEAREFARMKFDGGLILTAGTLNPTTEKGNPIGGDFGLA